MLEKEPLSKPQPRKGESIKKRVGLFTLTVQIENSLGRSHTKQDYKFNVHGVSLTLRRHIIGFTVTDAMSRNTRRRPTTIRA